MFSRCKYIIHFSRNQYNCQSNSDKSDRLLKKNRKVPHSLQKYSPIRVSGHKRVIFHIFTGGEGTWREYLTLPNILKEFNPNLTGYSTGTGEFLSDHSKLNVAYPVSADEDALRQAKILVKKMKTDPRIDFKNHWKMITIFFGANDICSAQCFDKDKGSATSHVRQLMYALDYLQNSLPRAFINLIPVLGNYI